MQKIFQQLNFGLMDQQDFNRQTFFYDRERTALRHANSSQNRTVYFHTAVDTATEDVNPWSSRFFVGLLSKKRMIFIQAFILVLVLLVHFFGLSWLRFPDNQDMTAQPKIMEVTLIPVSAPKPKASPPPAPAPAKIKPASKKTQPKQAFKKILAAKTSADLAPKQQVFEAQTKEQTTQETKASTATPTKNVPFTEATASADDAENPKPEYPSEARSNGWQGKVTLKVQVSDEGLSTAVAIHQSSGYESLDESAVEAVKQWKFTPAKLGETPVASTVFVPIIFTLEES